MSTTRSHGQNWPIGGKEVVRAATQLSDTVVSLLLTLYPASAVYRVGGGLERLILDPVPRDISSLRTKLSELVDRPEWRARHAITREVRDDDGDRIEVLVPQSADEYREGAGLVGPFASEAAADMWGTDHAVSTLSYDTFFTGTVWLCDLFALPERS